mgnify:CR=1 FL=1
MKEVGVKIKALDTQVADIDAQLTEIATTLPNLPQRLCSYW